MINWCTDIKLDALEYLLSDLICVRLIRPDTTITNRAQHMNCCLLYGHFLNIEAHSLGV